MYSAGIDLGGSSTKLALVSSRGRILNQTQVPAIPGEKAQNLFPRLGCLLRQMAESQGLPYPPPGGAGIGVPGIVDFRTGWVTLCGGLGLENYDIRKPAEAALGCNVSVDSDSNAGALGDLYWGRARHASNVLYISWGTGIGAGLVLGRRLYHSVPASMGEFGHTPADRESPRLCYCGCRGCLEIEAGGRAIALQATEVLGRAATVEKAASDPLCRAVIDRAVRLMARALAGALVLLNPDCVIFGGGVSRLLALAPVRAVFDEELLRAAPAFARERLTIALSAFHESAGVVGAAMLPRHQFDEEKSTDAKLPTSSGRPGRGTAVLHQR